MTERRGGASFVHYYNFMQPNGTGALENSRCPPLFGKILVMTYQLSNVL